MMYRLRFSGRDHSHLTRLLYSGDGLEAAAIVTCGHLKVAGLTVLLVQKIHEVPESAYIKREPNLLEWELEWMIPIINEAESRNLSLLKIHSHPSGIPSFSAIDDASDQEILQDWSTWFGTNTPHGSAVMLPSGEVFGRVLQGKSQFTPINSVSLAGDRYHNWSANRCTSSHHGDQDVRNIQAFGVGTVRALQRLKVAVIGYSGTGSVTVEQLARLGVGEIVIADPKSVERKNLNRILNATDQDALRKRSKVEVAKAAIDSMGFSTVVTPLPLNLASADVVREVASCDVVFGCMDGAEGRHILNRLATYYVIPYFDVGVSLDADGNGSVSEITGVVHYLQPGGSSLHSRGAYSLAEVEAETMARLQPKLYEERRKENYIAGVDEERPAVIPVNMYFSSLMVMEFLARVHGYRHSDGEFAFQQYNLEDPDKALRQDDGDPCPALSKRVGRGDVQPLLDLPILAE